MSGEVDEPGQDAAGLPPAVSYAEAGGPSAARARLGVTARRLLHAARLKRLSVARKSLPLRRYAARRFGIGALPPGVNLVGYIRAEMGLGTVIRGIAAALEVAGIPFNVINLEHGTYSRHGDSTWAHKEVTASGYDITIVGVHPDNSDNLKAWVPLNVLGGSYVINVWYWELPELPDEWGREFGYADEIWAGSRFIQDAISLKSPVPVVRVPPVVGLDLTRPLPREYFGLPAGPFLFLAMFDTNSVLERKNPLSAIRAFKRAFPRDDTRVALALKFNNPDPRQPVMRAVAEELGGCENVFVIDRATTRQEVGALIAAADCFVSLHRSEGFGLGPAEAMSLGKPAIMTGWSGNTDYMTRGNSIAVDYKLVELGRDYGPYKSHQHWAEPDIEHAAYWMRRIFEEPELRKGIGARGQETLGAEYSPESVGRLIRKRLEYIRRYA